MYTCGPFKTAGNTFESVFPICTSFIQQIHVGSGDEFDPTPIIESLKERHACVDKCIELYNTHPCSVHLFAKKIGTTELDAIKAFAQDPNGLVKCCQTTPNDFAQAIEHGETGDVIVLGITAVVTLTLVEGWSYLDPTKQHIVSQSTKDVVEQWLSDLEGLYAGEGGHASVTEDGQLIFQETTQEQRDARRAEVETIKEMIETHCECRSSESVAGIEPEKRDAYERVAGFHNVEAMSPAKDLNAMLWSDDHLLAFIAKNDFDVECVWTQLILRRFVDAGCRSTSTTW
jgi:hypothetical protein